MHEVARSLRASMPTAAAREDSMRRHTRRGCRLHRAFTLIELLVVISIIALLISILLPGLSRARKQGKGVVCLSNIRSLTSAVYLYTESSGGHFPTAGLTHGGHADDAVRSWVTQLAEDYGRNLEIARCPMDESVHFETALPDGRRRQTSFASNAYMVYPIAGQPIFDRWERIRTPAATIFWVELAEKGDFAAADHVHPENWWFGDSQQLAARELHLTRHLGRANYGFLDGHAEGMTFAKTYKIDPEGGFPPRFLLNKYDPTIAR
jgi:prepilin-type N-terminal cleavage/methylation domain-containing protein/prepilin-type processing-associated H-X9-DG protein